MLVSELRSEDEGVIWLGEREEQMAIIHSKRAGIILQGRSLQKWIEDGERRRYTERTVAVKIEEANFISVYQPSWGQEVEGGRAQMEQQLAAGTNREMTIMGGDFNAHIGEGSERLGVAGKYGLQTPTREAGESLLDWCEENKLAYVNCFYKHRNRSTWRHPARNTWYDLDGFIMKQKQRYCHARKIRTVNEGSYSDHKPKMLVLKMRTRRKWRSRGGKERGIQREDKTAQRNATARIQGRPGQLEYYIGYPRKGGRGGMWSGKEKYRKPLEHRT